MASLVCRGVRCLNEDFVLKYTISILEASEAASISVGRPEGARFCKFYESRHCAPTLEEVHKYPLQV
jgi:hypothetical protein